MVGIILAVVLAFFAIVALYIVYMSRNHGMLKKYGFESAKIVPLMGTTTFEPFMKQIENMYKQFKHKKAYAFYSPGLASAVVSDPDMIREILTRQFQNFPDRRENPKVGLYIDSMLTVLTGEHWKHVRSMLSPTFSSGKLKQISTLLEKTSEILVASLTQNMEVNEPLEMKETMSRFAMDVIANSAFGINIDSVNDPENGFHTAGKNIVTGVPFLFLLFGFFPFLVPVLRFFGIYALSKESLDFFGHFVDKAIAERRNEEGSKRNDFLQLIVDAERENRAAQEKEGDEGSRSMYRGLTNNEVKASAVMFILAGLDTTSTILSFAIFLFATNPKTLKKVQEEIDEKLGSKSPNYDNVANFTYLDMCVNETLRLYPPTIILERLCTHDTEVQGFHFPKGYLVQIPTYAINRDSEIWGDNPELFKPERFSPELHENRHPYTFLPFGQGPRNCIGMRLALLEIKIALVAVLQKLTPVPCDKTVFPIQLQGLKMESKDGLWLQFEKRR